MTGGRPLRFLALTLGGWVAIRIALLLPDPSLPSLAPAVTAAPLPPPLAYGAAMTPRRDRGAAADVSSRPLEPVASPRRAWTPRPEPYGRSLPISTTHDPSYRAHRSDPAIRFVPSPFAPPGAVRGTARFGGSAWLLARGGNGGTLSGGQLGASQAGLRITYALDAARRVAVVARLAAPLRGRGREAALGVEWQPTDLPIRFVAEQRFALDGGRGGPTVGLVGGYGPAPIAKRMRIEAYGQAGGIYRAGIEGFVDVSARVTHRVATIGGIPVDMGVGGWGSAQRDAARLDLGPSVVLAVPVARRSLRLTLDWRARVAGRARPGSGPALSIGSDF